MHAILLSIALSLPGQMWVEVGFPMPVGGFQVREGPYAGGSAYDPVTGYYTPDSFRRAQAAFR